MLRKILFAAIVIVTAISSVNSAVNAGLVMGTAPYLSEADIPSGFYTGGSPLALENFVDGTLDFGISASVGNVTSSSDAGADSVDGDDGSIDGSGTTGRSWFSSDGPGGVTFTFSGPLPTAAGVVWTDGEGVTTFEAFGAGMISLGTLSASIADGSTAGTTNEDRFFGVQESGGIMAIKLSNSMGGIEMDHVQFGISAIPEPSSVAMFSIGLLVVFRRRNRVVFGK